jgi:beta-galactosidase/beta-glucuronidase
VRYTRTTGIWQPVWLEAVPEVHLRRLRITPDLADSRIFLEIPVSANRAGWTVRAFLSDSTGEFAHAESRADLGLAPRLVLEVPRDRVRLWGPGHPHLYELRLELLDEHQHIADSVDSYAGLRSIAIEGQAVLINGERVFQRLVLDQGYWPQSLMTASSDAALVGDIRLALDAGFNGARLHQRVAEERFLFHADRLGYLVWGEFGDWGAVESDRSTPSLVAEWLEALERDYSHPSIVGWCPLNETSYPLGDRITGLDDITRALFLATRAADTTRPILDASGYAHRVPESDVFDSHLYEQHPTLFASHMYGLAEGTPYTNALADGRPHSVPYRGQPYFCSEFGGIWSDGAEDFVSRFAALVSVLLNDPRMFGYCYTQLTDVFQERNGIYRFDRTPKFDVSKLREIQARGAAFEREGPPMPTPGTV